jgi:hypothetical protein
VWLQPGDQIAGLARTWCTIAFEVAFLVPILPPFEVGGHATGSEPTALGRRSCLPRSLVFSSRSVRAVTARLSRKSTVNHDTEPSTAVKLKPTRTTVATLITIKIVTKARPKPVGSVPCTFDLWLLRIFSLLLLLLSVSSPLSLSLSDKARCTDKGRLAPASSPAPWTTFSAIAQP